MVVQKVARMDAVSEPVTASAVAVTAAVAGVAEAKAAVQRHALKVVRRVARKHEPRAALKIAMKAVAASAANAAQMPVMKRVLMHALTARARSVKNVKTAPLVRRALKRHATTAAPKTVNPAPTVPAVNAPAANAVIAQSVVTAHRAMQPSKTSQLPTRRRWLRLCAAMALNQRQIAPPKTLAALRAAVNVVTATVGATIAAVNVAKVKAQALNKKRSSTLKQRHSLQQELRYWTPAIRRLPSKAVSSVRGNVNRASVAAATVMAVNAANVVKALSARKQSR